MNIILQIALRRSKTVLSLVPDDMLMRAGASSPLVEVNADPLFLTIFEPFQSSLCLPFSLDFLALSSSSLFFLLHIALGKCFLVPM